MIKKTTLIIGTVLFIFGLAGFLPNPLVGKHAFFVTAVLHNLIYILVGLFVIFMGLNKENTGQKALKFFGGFFVLLAVLGFFAEEQKILGMILINSADTWLHFFLGALLLFYSEKFSKHAAGELKS